MLSQIFFDLTHLFSDSLYSVYRQEPILKSEHNNMSRYMKIA